MSSRITNETLEVYNPTTGENLSKIKITSKSELEDIFKLSKKVAKQYNVSSLYYRKKIINST